PQHREGRCAGRRTAGRDVTRDGKAYPPPSSVDDPTGGATDVQLDAALDEDLDGEYGPTWAGAFAALALAGASFLTGSRAGNGRWFLAGEASAAKMLAGQQWRAVTALFLHADRLHLAGNVAATAVLGTAVCRILGPGVGLLLIVTSGAVGNLM